MSEVRFGRYRVRVVVSGEALGFRALGVGMDEMEKLLKESCDKSLSSVFEGNPVTVESLTISEIDLAKIGDENLKPKFKEGDPVRVASYASVHGGKVGRVRSVNSHSVVGWSYTVSVPLGYGSSFCDVLESCLEPAKFKFRIGQRVRVKESGNPNISEYSGWVGSVSETPLSTGSWRYGVKLDKLSGFKPYTTTGFNEDELEAKEERPAPKFKSGEPVWVKKLAWGNMAEKVVLVSFSEYNPLYGWTYRVWIPLGGGPGREYGSVHEDYLEAIDRRDEDE